MAGDDDMNLILMAVFRSNMSLFRHPPERDYLVRSTNSQEAAHSPQQGRLGGDPCSLG